MQFNSYIFILFFLPILCVGYYWFITKSKIQLANFFLLILSLIFCAYSGKESLIILLLSIICNYIFYKGIIYFKGKEDNKKKQILLVCGVLTNLLILFYFKYYNFFVSTVNFVFDTRLDIREILQPIGISFIVFQQIAFLMDACYKEIEKCSFGNYALFISFFPHISSGPIIIYDDLIPRLKEKRYVNWDKISIGIYMFILGLGKKVLIADTFAKAVDWGYANVEILNSTSAIFVSVAYTVQIYYDFSGYSDMAIGLSKMLQLDLPMNFNSPYKAKTILEFWDRWHMTLTRFFTKYLYIPLGGSRKGIMRTYINTMIVFLCSGLWHGASLTFVLWGALHGCFMVFTKHFAKFFSRIPDVINQCITLTFINFTWILFRAGSFSSFKQMISAILKAEWGMIDNNLCEPFKPMIANIMSLENVPTWVWAFTALIGIWGIILGSKNVQEKAEDMKFIYSVKSCITISVVAVWCVLSFSGVSSFIYALF